MSKAEDELYGLLRIEHLDDLEHVDIKHSYHAVLLDMRVGTSQVLQIIKSIGAINRSVALLCLYQNHAQLQQQQEIIALVDDFLLADSMAEGELPTRISNAIHRHHKEAQLLSEKNLLKQLLENLPDAIYFKDKQSRFLKVSKTMNQIYGFSNPQEIIGKTDFDLFTPEHAQPAYDDDQSIITHFQHNGPRKQVQHTASLRPELGRTNACWRECCNKSCSCELKKTWTPSQDLR